MDFLDFVFPIEIDAGSAFGESFSQTITETAGGDRYVHEHHPYPQLRYEIGLQSRERQWLMDNILALFRKTKGAAAVFRVRNHAEFSTNGARLLPTAFDQLCIEEAGSFQIVAWYGDQGDLTQARRRIRAPRAGSEKVGVRGQEITSHFSVDHMTGLITFSNVTGTITNVQKGASTVIDISSHGYQAGDSIVITGVVGMTELNNVRAPISAVTAGSVTIDIDSTGFTDYVSGGTADTEPQSFEPVTAGCYFDFPMTFEDSAMMLQYVTGDILSSSAVLVEVLNP